MEIFYLTFKPTLSCRYFNLQYGGELRGGGREGIKEWMGGGEKEGQRHFSKFCYAASFINNMGLVL